MDTSDVQSSFVLTDIGEWVALNPNRLDKVFDLELELPDDVDNIDSIADLCNLRSLTIKRGISLTSLPDCLHDLEVHHVRLEGCYVKSFFTSPFYLETLEIINCLYVGDILASLKDLDCLDVLKIQGYHLECLPDSIAEISVPRVLEIQDCINLKKFPQNMGDLVDLNSLSLVNCGIDYIPSELCNLEHLTVDNCPMEFHDINELVSLVDLEIKSCCVKSLHRCITELTKLESLTLEDCVGLEELPTGINNLVSLNGLMIERCSRIKFLPSLAALHELWNLSLKGCSSLNELPAHFDKLTNLSFLNLKDTNIQSLPSTITNLPKLICIELPLCFRLGTLPNDLDLNVIAVFLPESFRPDTLPAEFSSVQRNYEAGYCEAGYRIYWKAAPSKQADGESHQEESRQVVISKQRTVNTPPNLTQLLPGGHDHQLEGRDFDREGIAGEIAAQSDSNIDARNLVGEASNYAFENGQIGIMTSGCEHDLKPLDHSDMQNVPVKSNRQKGKITSEYIQQCFSKKMKLVDAAAQLGVSRSTLKRRLKELQINEWPSSRRGNRHNSSKKKDHNSKLTFVSESLEMNSADHSDKPDQAHTSECSDLINQLILQYCGSGDAFPRITTGEKTCTDTISQMSSVDFGTNVIGETSSCITPHTVEDALSDALTLISEGGRHHMLQESKGAPSVEYDESNKRLSKELIKSLMDEGISEEAAAVRLNVSLATLKCHREHHSCGMWPSRKTKKFNVELDTGSKPLPLDSATITDAVYQEHTEHLHSSISKYYSPWR